LYDLGDFDPKGSIATKFGTKNYLLNLSKKSKSLGFDLLFDAVPNHKAGADHTEKCKAIGVDENGSWLPHSKNGRSDLIVVGRSHERIRRAT
jgi:maltooligosyltrehalose synthase